MGLTNKMHRFIENSNKKVLTRAMYSCQFHACLVFFFEVYSAFSTFYCGFENNGGSSMCNFQAETESGYSSTSGYIWLHQSGRPSSQTGPNMDHTYETSTGIS